MGYLLAYIWVHACQMYVFLSFCLEIPLSKKAIHVIYCTTIDSPVTKVSCYSVYLDLTSRLITLTSLITTYDPIKYNSSLGTKTSFYQDLVN